MTYQKEYFLLTIVTGLLLLSGCGDSCNNVFLNKESLIELSEILRNDGNVIDFFEGKNSHLEKVEMKEVLMKDGYGIKILDNSKVPREIYSSSQDCKDEFTVITLKGNQTKNVAGNSVILIYRDSDSYSAQREEISNLKNMTFGTSMFFDDTEKYLQERLNLGFKELRFESYKIQDLLMYRSKDVKTQFEGFRIFDKNKQKVIFMIVIRAYPLPE